MIFQNFSNPSQILSPTPSITVRRVQRLIVWIYPYLWRAGRLREHSCRGKWRCRIVKSKASPGITSSDRFLCSESTKTDSSHRLSSTVVCSLFARPKTDGQRQPFWNELNFVKMKRTTRTCRFTNVIEVSGGNWDFLFKSNWLYFTTISGYSYARTGFFIGAIEKNKIWKWKIKQTFDLYNARAESALLREAVTLAMM